MKATFPATNPPFPMEWLAQPWDEVHDPKLVKAVFKWNENRGFPVSTKEMIDLIEKHKHINVMEKVFGGIVKNKSVLNVMFEREVAK